jgi:hypothetical protein
LDVTVNSLVAVAWPALYAAGSVWFYLHCVRPSFLLRRAEWIAHVPFAALSLVPVIVLSIAPREPTLPFLLALSWTGLVAAWLFPGSVLRATGGVALAKRNVDVVFGWLSPASQHLDVGDLDAAQAQVDEARRHATAESTLYVDLWDALVREEQERRDGKRVSRLARLEAISNEYDRLVLGGDPLSSVLRWAAVIAAGAIVLIRLAAIG